MAVPDAHARRCGRRHPDGPRRGSPPSPGGAGRRPSRYHASAPTSAKRYVSTPVAASSTSNPAASICATASGSHERLGRRAACSNKSRAVVEVGVVDLLREEHAARRSRTPRDLAPRRTPRGGSRRGGTRRRGTAAGHAGPGRSVPRCRRRLRRARARRRSTRTRARRERRRSAATLRSRPCAAAVPGASASHSPPPVPMSSRSGDVARSSSTIRV